jgi:hydroxymethylglutaryl-CoA reductase (NADPH)
VVAEILLPHEVVERRLRTTARRIADLSVRKNLVGSTIAGAIRSANAHYANMLLAFYLATGQDAANIVEGSQGITYAEDREGGLYFSCTLPHLIVGTVGNGKHLAHVNTNLERLGCREEREPGANARRLAALMAATVLCGELSLLAAQTNPGELMAAHLLMERKEKPSA